MPNHNASNTASRPPRILLGTTGSLPDDLIGSLADHGVAVRRIAEDDDPPVDVGVVLVLRPPSPLIGRCRGRWPVIVVVDDPRATDVSRLLRSGATDVVRHPVQVEDLASRIRRASARPSDGGG